MSTADESDDPSAEASDAPEPLPHRVGRFVVLGALGRGGMGMVLRAYDEALDRQVAVKLMHTKRDRSRRMLREAQALARLSHPNVVQIYEVGEVEDELFLAMELVSGQTLEQWQEQRHSWRQCVDIYRQAAQGLAAAHAAGLVHRDFKPANCILDEQGRVRVLDFGLARFEGDEAGDEVPSLEQLDRSTKADLERSYDEDGGRALRQALTRTGSMMGTVAYMAPEQTRGRNVDARSDQFSFCVSLYEALYGQPPFSDNPMSDLLKMAFGKRVTPRPPPPGSRAPPWLARLLARGLSGAPEDRWPSMDALIGELSRHERRTWARWGSWAVALGAVSWTVVDSMASTPVEPSCESATESVAAAWNDEQRARVQAAIVDTRLPYAEQTWSLLEARLDEYAETLTVAHHDACMAGDTIEGPYRRCLGTRVDALRRTISVLEDADEVVVERGVELVAGLPLVERCAEDEARERSDPSGVEPLPPELVERLEQARVLTRAGRSAQALEQLGPALAQAEAPADRAIAVRVRLTEGFVLMRDGQIGAAEQRLREALEGALGLGLDAEALEAATSLAYLVGVDKTSAEAGLWLGSVAEGLAEGDDAQGTPRAEALTVIAQVLASRGEYARAQARYEHALQILATEAGGDDLSMVVALNGLGQVHAGQGRLHRAQSYYERALATRVEALGDRHPQVAYQRINLGNVLVSQSEFAAAQDQYRRALEVLETLPTQHKLLAQAYTGLGVLQGKQGDAEQGEQQLRRAIEHWQALYGPDHLLVAKARASLGANLSRRGLPEQAVEQYQQILRAVGQGEPTPAKDRLLAPVLRSMGAVHHEEGRLDEAADFYEASLRVFWRLDPAGGVPAIKLLNRLGKIRSEQGRHEDAVGEHRDALTMLEALDRSDSRLLASTLLLSSRARHRVGDSTKALDEVERALAIIQTGLDDPDLEAEAAQLRDAIAHAVEPHAP